MQNGTPKSCEYCGADNVPLNYYDSTGRLFCSSKHYMQFYEERRSQHLAPSNCPLGSDEVLLMEQGHHELYGPHSKFAGLSYEQKVRRIDEARRDLFKKRAELLAMERALKDSQTSQVAATLEQSRKFGPEVKTVKKVVKLQGALEKSISSYYGMGMDDVSIAKYVSLGSVGTVSEQTVIEEILKMRTDEKIGPAKQLKDLATNLGIRPQNSGKEQ